MKNAGIADATTAFDYIVVGAGSAGCVLANRLSEDPANRVLLIECGPDDKSPLIRMPRGVGKLLDPRNPHVFAYNVAPGGNQPEEVWLKGRAMGGSSSVRKAFRCARRPHTRPGNMARSWGAAENFAAKGEQSCHCGIARGGSGIGRTHRA